MKFDPYNTSHVYAYRQMCETGVWPDDQDIEERGDPNWIIVIISRMARAWVYKDE